jgi:hypothetical protein
MQFFLITESKKDKLANFIGLLSRLFLFFKNDGRTYVDIAACVLQKSSLLPKLHSHVAGGPNANAVYWASWT